MAIDNARLMAKCATAHKTITPQRLCILQALPDNGRPMTAYSLRDQLMADSKRYNISTIYRVLDFWVSLGVVHKIDSTSAYMRCQDDHDHHLHVIQLCTECQSVEEACAVSQALTLPSQPGFQPTPNQVIELKGLCKDCRQA